MGGYNLAKTGFLTTKAQRHEAKRQKLKGKIKKGKLCVLTAHLSSKGFIGDASSRQGVSSW
jgi:hypothetical protein